MRGILKALVAVELQLRSDSLFLFLHCQPDRVQNKIAGLPGCCLIGHDAVVIQITDHRQIQHTLLGLDIGYIRYPFYVRLISTELLF